MGTPAEESAPLENEVIVEGEGEAALEVEAVEPVLDDEGNIVEPEAAVEEFEVVRAGTQPEFSRQQVNDIVSKRVKRLNNKVAEKAGSDEQGQADLAVEKERNKILEIALEQAKANKKAIVKLPNPNDFDEGMSDPGYVKQHGDYTQAMIADQVADQVARATESVSNTTNQEQKSSALLRKQEKHYERADKIGAKDYEVTEDKALEVLGNDTANHIIDNFDDSHVIMYFLGKNPDEAARIANLLKTQPIKGVAEVGRLSAQLQVKPKNKPAPSPDEEIVGDVSSSRKKRKGPTFE